MSDDLEISYEALWKSIIRPPRDIYMEDLLGEKIFKFRNMSYIRHDYEIVNDRGYVLQCSYVEPEKSNRPYDIMPVVVYLHGNSSSRIEGLRCMNELLKRNINVFVYDSCGCGISEGEYISLGYYESKDLETIINFIERLEGIGKIGIWGRSMGAATCLLYNSKKNNMKISAACYDSSFSNFNQLAKELCKKMINIPGLLISAALSIIRRSIIKRNGLDIEMLNPVNGSCNINIPGFFIHAKNDELINMDHTIDIHSKYGGVKVLNICEGSHNTPRSRLLMENVSLFFEKYLYDEKKADDI